MSRKDKRAPLPLRLAWREIANSRNFCLYFGLNLVLGLAGFLLLDAFRTSLGDYLGERSKAILGADLVVSGRRDLTDDERRLLTTNLPEGSTLRREISTFSMVATSSGESRLVELKIIDNHFPFYGALQLQNAGDVSFASEKAVTKRPVVWVYPELLIQLGISIGDSLKIGDTQFTVEDVVIDDPAASAVGLTAAPKVFLGETFVEKTGLIQKGSRIRYASLIRLPESLDGEVFAKQLKDILPRGELRVRGHKQASEQLGRVLQYVSDYLGLTAIVALFLAGVGGAYLFRSFLMRRSKDIAILLSMGLSARKIQAVYVLQIALLGLAATAVALLFAFLLFPLFPQFLGDLLPVGFSISLSVQTLIVGAALALISSVLVCLPLLSRIETVKPSALFHEQIRPQFNVSARGMLLYAPALFLYWGLAVVQAKSIIVGSLFIAVFLGSAFFMGLFAAFLLRFMKHPPRTWPLTLRFSLISLSRNPVPTVAAFLAIGLGALLINVIPQLRSILVAELSSPEGMRLPSLFMFDIQEDQLDALQDLVKTERTALQQLSPLVRARITSVNGEEPTSKDKDDDELMTREDEESERFRNRGHNLSYRGELTTSEEIIEGRDFSNDRHDGAPAEVSIETRFASRYGLKIGDKIVFDVQGVELEALVVNLRKIKWTSFLPNFFIQFPPGVLEEAPKTFLAASEPLTFDEKIKLQNAIVGKFPNVSVVDVSRVIERIVNIIAQVTTAVTFMAYLSLLAGLAVLFSIAFHQAEMRQRDTVLLKVLGTSFAKLRMMAIYEYALLGLSAALFGSLFGSGISLMLGLIFFESMAGFEPSVTLLSTLAVTALVVLTGTLATIRTLHQSPAKLLAGG